MVSANKQFATVNEAAEWSGLSSRTIRRLLQANELTSFRPLADCVIVNLQELDMVIRNSEGRKGSRGRGLARWRKKRMKKKTRPATR
jgi:excisionase family DNA binding protein